MVILKQGIQPCSKRSHYFKIIDTFEIILFQLVLEQNHINHFYKSDSTIPSDQQNDLNKKIVNRNY